MSKRAHLHQLARHLRRYLAWQRSEGIDAVVPASPQEREVFEARKKKRQDRQLADLRSQITGEETPKTAKKEQPPQASSPKPEQKQAPKEAANTGDQTSKEGGDGDNSDDKPAFTPDFAAHAEKSKAKAVTSPSNADQGVSASTPLWKQHEAIHKLQSDKQKQAEARASKAKQSQQSQQSQQQPPPQYSEEPPPQRSQPTGSEAPPRGQTSQKPETPQEKLDFLQNYLGDCTRCPLCEGRTNIVFGEGAAQARLMFIGEGPGRTEDEKGRPFVGPSGQLLTKMIGAMGLSREEVYITNVVKCRPPDNRNPAASEIRECSPFLKKQIQVIEPEVIVTVGRFATVNVLDEDQPLGALRGRWHNYLGIDVMPTYHPAYLLRNEGDKRFKKKTWSDLKMVMKRLDLGEN